MSKFLQGKFEPNIVFHGAGNNQSRSFDRGQQVELRFFERPSPLLPNPDGGGCFAMPRCCMHTFLRKIWSDIEGQDVAEYAVMVGAVVVLVFALMRAL